MKGSTKDAAVALASYPFLLEGATERWLILICNNLSFGQAELARALIRQMAGVDPATAQALLRRLALHGLPAHAKWFACDAVPAGAHLVWLCINELRAINQADELSKADLIERVEFELLLHHCLSGQLFHSSDSEHAELTAAVEEVRKRRKSDGAHLPRSAIAPLRRLLLTCPDVGTGLWAGLGVGEAEWRGLISLLEEQWAKGQHRTAARLLRLLPRYVHANAESLGPITGLLTRLAQQTPADDLARTANRVYEGLLAAGGGTGADVQATMELLRVFANAHASVIAALAQQQPLHAFLRLRGRTEEGEGEDEDDHELEEQVWGDLYEIVVANRKHVLSYVLELALGLVKERRLDEVELVLAAFGRLRAWVLLLAWDSFEGDIGWRQKIVDALWGADGDDKARASAEWARTDPAWSAYGVLRHRLKIAWWSAAQLLAAPKALHSAIRVGAGRESLETYTSPFQLANALLSLLSRHSLLHLLRARLPDLDLHELRDILHSNPDSSPASQQEKARDENLLLAFHALRRLLLLIHQTSIPTTTPTKATETTKKDNDKGDDQDEEELSEEELIEDVMDDIRECVSGIQPTGPRLAVLEALYATLFATSHHLLARRNSAPNGDGHHQMSSPAFIVQEKVVAPVLQLVGTSLESIPESRRKRALVELVDEAQWRLGLIRAFSRSSRGHALLPAQGPAPAIMARMAASPDGLAVNALRVNDLASWRSVRDRYPGLHPQVMAEARLSQALQDALAALRTRGDCSLEGLLEGLSSEEKHLVTSDVAFLARGTDAEARARLLLQASHGMQALYRASRGVDYLAHVSGLLERLGVLLRAVGEGSSLSPADPTAALAVQLARAYVLSKKEKASAEQLKEGLKRRANLVSAVQRLRLLATGRQKKSLPSQTLNELIPHLSAAKSGVSYVSRFLSHLMLLGQTLGTESDALQHLRLSPRRLLSSLVFEAKQYDKATKLGQAIGEDICGVVLESLETGERGLSMHVVRYLADHWPLAAAAACILRPQSSRFRPKLLHYALAATLPYGPVHSWARLRAQMYGQFASVYMNDPSLSNALANEEDDGEGDDDDNNNSNEDGEVDARAANRRASGSSGFRRPAEVKSSPALDPNQLRTSAGELDGGFVFDDDLREPGNDEREALTSKLTTSAPIETRRRASDDNSSDQLRRARAALLSGSTADYATSLVSHSQTVVKPRGARSPSPPATAFSYRTMASFHGPRAGPGSEGARRRTRLPPAPPPGGDQTLAPEEEKLLRLVAEDDPVADEHFCQKAVERLVLANKLEEALHFADASLPNGAPDFLLRLLVEKAQDKSTIWQHIVRITDADVAAHMVLRHLQSWPLEVCLELLSMCRDRVSPSAPTAEEVERQYRQLTALRDVLQVEGALARWRTWQNLAQACREQPSAVVVALMDLRQWKLARQLAQVYGAEGVGARIEEARVVHLLTTQNDTAGAGEALSGLQQHEAVAIITALLDKPLSPDPARNHPLKLFLVQYGLSHLRSALTPGQLELLSKRELGLRALLELGPDQQKLFEKLVDHPGLIVESLIMSEQTSHARLLLLRLPSLVDDALLIAYAQKALLFPIVDGSRARPTAQTWVLTGDDAADAQLRVKHAYGSAPSMHLGKALLDLVAQPKKAGEACLVVCDRLSSGLPDRPSDEKLHTINLIQQLLLYAKLQFLRAPDASGGVSLCDTILSHVELLQTLTLSKCPLGKISLMDFSDPHKARQQRDKLIGQDRMKLALDVATKCSIDAEPVWAALGMALLRMPRYNDAKEKFKYCLPAASDRGGSYAGGLDPSTLLRNIINALESGAPTDASDLRALHAQLSGGSMSSFSGSSLGLSSPFSSSNLPPLASASPSRGVSTPPATPTKPASRGFFADLFGSGSKQNESPARTGSGASTPVRREASSGTNSSGGPGGQQQKGGSGKLDSIRFMQCVYYLRLYGSPRQQVAFWTHHALYEDACSYIVANSLPAAVFVEDVFLVALAHTQLPLLLRAIRKIDRGLSQVGKYLLEACKLLNAKGAFRLLLTLQEFMKDHVRAALTSIKVSHTTADVSAKLKYLEQAKAFLLEGLEDLQSRRGEAAAPPQPAPQASSSTSAGAASTATAAESPAAVLSESEITRYLRTLNLQMEVIRYFAGLMQARSAPPGLSLKQLSLFGQQAQKAEVAGELLGCFNHELAFRVMQEFRLPMAPIYVEAIRKIAGKRQVAKVFEFLKNVKGSVDDKDWDEVVLAAIKTMVQDHGDPKTGEKLVDKLVFPQSKVLALILCGKLKSAYLAAVKANDAALIIKIRDEASRTGTPGVAELCQKFLAAHH